MGRSRTPTYRLEVKTDRARWEPMAWRTTGPGPAKGYGKPSLTNLERWVDEMERSTCPGGVNAHLGVTIIREARIIHQSTGEAVFGYENWTGMN